MSTAEADFEKAADATLRSLRDQLDALELDAEVELSMGIVSVEFPDGAKYIVNSHRAARQIWVAAERTAWHFDLVGAAWVAAKSNEELFATLANVLRKKLGREVPLKSAT